jgi:hypothetical protein
MVRKSITTREELSKYVYELLKELEQNGEEWENNTLPNFLDAMGAWIEDMNGFYMNTKTEPVNVNRWQMFADILAAATVYE